MKTVRVVLPVVLFFCFCGLSHADFKYSQQTKMTGGTLMQMTQTLGKFSKSMRQANEPQTSTTMVKGNRMRQENPDGHVQIIDLDGRRFIYIDDAKKQYSIMTFEEFKAALQRAQEQAKQAQQQEAAKNPQAPQNVKITPKFDAQVTGASRQILGVTANEMKMKMEMEFQGTDPKTQQQQSGSYVVSSDAWMAPSVPGYDEINNFHQKMAKELDWLPGAMSGATGLNVQNPQMGSAMEEFRKNAATVKGMPLLMTTSMTMVANGMPPQGQTPQATQQAQTPPPQQSQSPDIPTSVPTSASSAVSQGLGGLFGGLKKKHDQQQQQQQQQAAQNASTPPGQPGSLMDMTTEVTTISSAPLDSSLFDVPAGYTQVQRNPDEVLGGSKQQH